MSAKKRNPQTLVLDPSFAQPGDEVDTREHLDEEPADADDMAVALCPHCGELLAWHEEACPAPAVPWNKLPVNELQATGEAPRGLTPSPFTYALGQPVQPTPTTRVGTIIWRGQVKERHPGTGLLQRVNVYRLDNEFWDCYFEAELQAIA
ncbi:hypothetical protein [uncultured Hymenobacter sp.]|uniref:hypothetical protein n=1 Tax=uncultured Hymenobacter sp. TaxID=170016 RepID=UPI0035CC9884